MNDILNIKGLDFSYHTIKGETQAIDDISLNVKEGEFVSIVGPSGCGKSTLLSLLAGLIEPTKGQIEFNERINGFDVEKIGYMLQKDHLFEWRNIYQNTLLGLEISNGLSEDSTGYVNSLLKKYDLYKFKDYKPSQLSGGMRQRVALIRTLALKPKLLLLDEPFSALDYQTRLKVADDIYRIIKAENKTAILVTHDIAEAISMADRVVILTKRPASIKSIIDITFRDEDRTPFKVRGMKEFGGYFNRIWEGLEDDESTI